MCDRRRITFTVKLAAESREICVSNPIQAHPIAAETSRDSAYSRIDRPPRPQFQRFSGPKAWGFEFWRTTTPCFEEVASRSRPSTGLSVLETRGRAKLPRSKREPPPWFLVNMPVGWCSVSICSLANLFMLTITAAIGVA
jgi:hypothetical protein